MAKSRGGIIGLITFITGLLFGGLATLLLSTDEAGDTKEKVKEKVKTVKTNFQDITDKDKIVEIYGKASAAGLKQYQTAKAQISKKLDLLKKSLDTIDKEKYKSLVTDVVSELKKDGALTAAQLKKMTTFLQDDYQTLIAQTKKKSVKAKK